MTGIGAGLITTGVTFAVASAVTGVGIPVSAMALGAVAASIIGCAVGVYIANNFTQVKYSTPPSYTNVLTVDQEVFQQILNGVVGSQNYVIGLYNNMGDLVKGFQYDVAKIVAVNLGNPYGFQSALSEYIQNSVTVMQNALNNLANVLQNGATLLASFFESIGNVVGGFSGNGMLFFQPGNAIGGVITATLDTPVGQFTIPLGLALKVNTLAPVCNSTPLNYAYDFYFGSGTPSQFCASSAISNPAYYQYNQPAVVIFLLANPQTLGGFSLTYNVTFSDGSTYSLSTNPNSWGNVSQMTVSPNNWYGIFPAIFNTIYYLAGMSPGNWCLNNVCSNMTFNCNSATGKCTNVNVVVPVNAPQNPIVDLSPIVAIVSTYANALNSLDQYGQALYNLYTELGLTPEQALGQLGVLNVSILQPLCSMASSAYNDLMLQLSIIYKTFSNLVNTPNSIQPSHAVASGAWLKVNSAVINGSQYQGTTYLAFDQPRVVIPAGQNYTYKGTVIVYNDATGGTILVNPTINLPVTGYYVFYMDVWYQGGTCQFVPVTSWKTLSPLPFGTQTGVGYVWNVNNVITVSTSPVSNNGFVTLGNVTNSSNPYPVTATASPEVVYVPYNVAFAVYTPQGLATIPAKSYQAPNVGEILSLIILASIAFGFALGYPKTRQYMATQAKKAGSYVYTKARQAWQTVGVRRRRS